MRFPKTIIFWLLILGTMVWLFPKTVGLKFSNLSYRRDNGATRQVVDTNQAPWNAVGRLLLPKGICSATLIAPNIIVSARHCFLGKKIEASQIGFQLERGGKLQTVSALATIFYPKVGPEFLTPMQKRQETDYAFATLATPIDIKKLGIILPAIATASPSKNQELLQAGYGANHEKLYGDYCAAIAIINSVIQHNCLITFGDSGAQFFYKQNNQWFLAGINSYFEQMYLVQHAFAVGPENYYRALQDFINQ